MRLLEQREEPVRALVRNEERGRQLLGEAVKIAVGDFDDHDSIRHALRGVDAVFLSSADGPAKVAHETAVIDAAAAAGVRRIVKCSTMLAEVGSPLPPFDWHGRIEEHLRASSVASVVLQSCFYMTNLLMAAESIRETASIFAPAGEGRIATIDPRDTAAVGAVALTQHGHDGRTYQLTGPQALTYCEIAETLSAATGFSIGFVDVPDDAARDALVAAGMPDWLVTHLGALFPLIRQDALAETTTTVRDLTGAEPRSFGDFAQDHTDAFGPHVVVGQR